MLKNKEILVFDFETTGLDSRNDEIIEIGAVKYELIEGNYQQTAELSLILKTTVLISAKITEITGITKAMQDEQGVSQEEGFQRLSSLINDETLLIAYNIQFDLGFLLNFYHKYYSRSFEIKNNILDVMAVYKDRHKFPWRLEEALKTYQINLPNSHRALDDTKATFAVLVALANEKDTIAKYVNAIGFNKKYGVSGPRLPHVRYIAQYGGYREIEKA